MQIVIDIDEEEYKQTLEDMWDVPIYLKEAIVNGIPLPKGCDIQRIIPKRVDIQKWIYTKCPNPNCNHELSTHHGDGYYTIDLKPDFCPNCGQALLWKSELENQ